MPRYELTEAADADLSELYAYTFATFGERQADAYFESLDDCFARLADNPRPGRDVSFLRHRHRLYVHQRHSIYYQALKSKILVVRVLGPGMNPDAHLSR